MQNQAARPRRALRVSQACDYCHKRKIKCRSSQLDSTQCQNCVDFGLACIHSRPFRRSQVATHLIGTGTQVGANAAIDTASSISHNQHQVAEHPVAVSRYEGKPNKSFGTSSQDADVGRLSIAWSAFARSSSPLVRELLSVYFETVYPIFPLFDRLNLERRLEDEEQNRNRGFFCSVMAACALASARIRDGALVSLDRHSPDIGLMPPEIFFVAAEESLPSDLLQTRDFDLLRACALLALVCIQDGKIDAMRKYIGHYFTMMAIHRWHDESNWPQNLQVVGIEERRRLYWSIYTLDVYTSIVWDGCFHFQEAHARVEYPRGQSEVEGANSLSAPYHESWMVGWNFTTDLYRILEHAINQLRNRNSRFNLFGGTMSAEVASAGGNVLDRVNTMYSALPPRFKELRPATGDLETDIYGFQAANIQATLALLRMVLFSLEGDVDLEKKCSVASNVLTTFHQVPREFQRAISTPLIYHIAGIGNILGSVMEGPLSERSYKHVRELLISMAALLESLEACLSRRTGAGRRLREQVEQIDKYMSSRREHLLVQPDQDQGRNNTLQPPILEGSDPATIENLSPLFHIPDELLLDWDWPLDVYQTNLPFFYQPG